MRATCSCGSLAITVEGAPDRVSICACEACQRRTGSVYGVGTYFQKAATRISGSRKSFRRLSDGGGWVENSFCPRCGSTVFWALEIYPDSYGIAYGAFAGQTLPAPASAIWVQQKPDWAPLPDGIVTHAAARPAPPPTK